MMTIDYFVENLKDKTLKLRIIEEYKNSLEVVFLGDVTSFLKWEERRMYGSFMISNIVPNTKEFTIYYKL